ncbi:hypothetical protein ACQCVP_17060 [Rossellomorea vietnamensis]|uniref:hypothetical protein n=1 Tax=Rossellomorea vietnamensis TaxID=218284 RepID=UPI003CFB3965
MKKSTKGLIVGSLVSAGGAALATAAIKKKKGDDPEVIEDTDMRNSKKIDQRESPDADKTDEEKGLTELDHAYRAEWSANGFPQTHQAMEELKEEDEKDEKDEEDKKE